MKVPLYNQQGEQAGEIELPSSVFEVPLSPDLVYQVVTAQMGNRRRVIAHTKTRAEVSGGGKKPWPQKHTGQARHGSIRSPIWKGGGIVFGPRNIRVFKKKINEKMRRKALLMVLSQKAKDNQLIVLDSLTIDQPKTKMLSSILKKLPTNAKTSLIGLPTLDQNVILAARNLPRTYALQARDFNAFDLLNVKYLVMPKESLKVIEETFVK